MNSKELKQRCEELGFGIAHAREYKRKGFTAAYVAVTHQDYPEITELRHRESAVYITGLAIDDKGRARIIKTFTVERNLETGFESP